MTAKAYEDESTEDITPEDELWQVAEKTNDDGTVNGTILGWEKQSTRGTPKTLVDVRLPNGTRFTEAMAWPGSDDPREYMFVRIVSHCGYSLASAGHIEGHEVPCERTDGDWQISVEYQPPTRQRLHTVLKTIFLPAFMIRAFKQTIDEDAMYSDPADYMMLSVFLLSIWGGGIFLLWMALYVLFSVPFPFA